MSRRHKYRFTGLRGLGNPDDGSVDETGDTDEQYLIGYNEGLDAGYGNAQAAAAARPVTAATVNPSTLDMMKQLVSLGISYRNTTNITDLNRQLIAAGRPPLTAQQLQSLQTAVPVGLAADQAQFVKMAVIAVLGIIAISMLTKPKS